MKKLLLIAAAALLVAGMAGVVIAASSQPTGMKVDLTANNQTLRIWGWAGTATALWDSFLIYCHDTTGVMWGTWWRGDDLGGWIDGVGEWDPSQVRILGSGTFGGDDNGEWEGFFYPADRCWGTVWNANAIGEFHGRACE